jgi:hypothetical protein
MRSPEDLVSRYAGQGASLPIGTALYCGTLPVHGQIRFGERFEVELQDPMSDRSLRHSYEVRSLPFGD